MKSILVIFSLALFAVSVAGQEVNKLYDPILAKTLGADDYGMKSYIFVLLKSGSNNLGKGSVRDSLIAGHLKNIGRLADSGKLVIAGPMLEVNPMSYRGIFVLNVTTLEEAKTLLQTDPAIKEKIFEAELYKWYGPAALPVYLITQDKIHTHKYR
ncbi:MAG: YciI family protein [Prolixibacteraceae bacterium]|jgi:uncharacterized protein YciI|nr:YciI family protein [Prolixibacteraceae bacterium]